MVLPWVGMLQDMVLPLGWNVNGSLPSRVERWIGIQREMKAEHWIQTFEPRNSILNSRKRTYTFSPIRIGLFDIRRGY